MTSGKLVHGKHKRKPLVVSWILRAFIIIAGVVAGWFVSKDSIQ
jgi:hypothetical protein